MNLRLFSANGANCCERVLWVLDYKKVDFELLDVDLPEHTRQLKEFSPFGRVPVLLTPDGPISESMAICELIEELASTPRLLGHAAIERARIREVCEAINASIHPVQNRSVVRFFHPAWSNEEMTPLRVRWLEDNLQKLSCRLWHSSHFAVGSMFTLADIFVALMYKKALSLGASIDRLSEFDRHWRHLMSVPEISRSCPLADVGRDI